VVLCITGTHCRTKLVCIATKKYERHLCTSVTWMHNFWCQCNDLQKLVDDVFVSAGAEALFADLGHFSMRSIQVRVQTWCAHAVR